MKNPVDILFLGLVREKEMFKKSIMDFKEMQKQGLVNKILFSTWDYEPKKHPEIFKFLKDNKVKVLANKEPEDRGIGNIWCQMKSLEVGLNNIDKDRFVLKTRSDVYIQPQFLKKLFTKKESLLKINNKLPKGNVFKYKIWTHYFVLNVPFHMGEECFFGYRDDLKQLINYDKAYDEEYKVGGAISHIRRMVHPFVKDYPILKRFLSKYSKDGLLKSTAIKFSKKFFEIREFKFLRMLSEFNKFKRLRNNFKDARFLDSLATYYSIIHSHFYIDGNSVKNQISFYRNMYSTDVRLHPTNITLNLSKARSYPKYSGQVYGHDMEFLNNIVNKNLKPDIYSKKLIEAINRFNAS
jgi:hypothetical protein